MKLEGNGKNGRLFISVAESDFEYGVRHYTGLLPRKQKGCRIPPDCLAYRIPSLLVFSSELRATNICMWLAYFY